MTKRSTKLNLHKETLRNLTADEMEHANGGTWWTTVYVITPPVARFTMGMSNPCGRGGAALDLLKKAVSNNHYQPGHFGMGK